MWESDIKTVEGSPQMLELAAVVRAFSKFTCPFNLVTDSVYVAGIIERVENSFLKTVTSDQLYMLLKKLIFILFQRQHPYFINFQILRPFRLITWEKGSACVLTGGRPQ